MGFRFRKSANLGPLRVNFSKSGVGYSVGGKGFRVTKRADGKTQTTASVPGTGIAYTKVSGSSSGKSAGKSGSASGKKKGPVGSAVLIVLLLVGLAGCMAMGESNSETSQPAKAESASTEKTDDTAPQQVESDDPSEDTSAEPVETPVETHQDVPDASKDEPNAEPVESVTEHAEVPAAPIESTPVKEALAQASPAADPQATMVIGNRNSKVYHEPSCSSVRDMKEKNKVDFDSAEAAKASGYTPCSRCH
ncbi:MAG: DUF4236 domain-containing protein [Dysosmobacter sp.]|nr:DUF4236 domain-containing protein [Dysosmobacter sp.]